MSALAKVLSAPSSEENRRFQRVRVDVLGRFMLSDRREFPCQVIDMSPGGAAIVAPSSAASVSGSSPISTISAESRA